MRAQATETFLGIVLALVGFFLDSEMVMLTGVVPDVVAPLTFIAGLLIVTHGTRLPD
jgi:hypothetical protein